MRRIATVLVLSFVFATMPSVAQQSSNLPDLGETGVVVPWEDFKLILDEIRKPPEVEPPPPPPVPFAYSACEVSASTDSEETRLSMTLSFEVQVLDPGEWVQVPVLPDGVAVSSVTMDGAPARLFRQGGYFNLALRGAGRHRITAEALAPVQESRGHKSARLRFPQVPAVTLDLSVPRADLEVQVDGAVVQSLPGAAEATRVRATLQQTRDTTVTWFRKVEADEKTSKIFAEVATLLSVGEGVVRGTTSAGFTIHGRGVDTFRMSVPSDVNVLDVDAHGITSWGVEEPPAEGEPAVVVVRLNFQAQGRYTFQLSFEKHLEDTTATFELPDLQMLDVLRERGFVAVAAATNVEITPQGSLENAAPVDPAELPQSLAGTSGETVLYAFKYLRHPVVVPMSVVKHQDVAVKRSIVEHAQLQTFISPQGRRVTSARYRVKNNRKQYLAVELAENAVLWGAYRDDRPVKAARRDDGVILVPLKMTAISDAGELRSFSVEVVYFEPGRRVPAFGTRHVTAPQLDVDTMEIRWRLFMPRDKRYFRFSGNLEEDPAANRIAFLGRVAYNLENPGELALLDLVIRDGKTVVTDGANEMLFDHITVSSAGEDRMMAHDELNRISGGEASPAPPAIDQPMQLEEDGEAARQQIQQMEEQLTQVPMVSNVAMGATVAGAGGRAHGVLPVQFTIPSEGLRLSFVGRLVTAGDRPDVAMGFVPASWQLPALNTFWVAVLAFAATLVVGLLLGHGVAEISRGGWAAVVLAAAVLAATFFLSGGHRVAFVVAIALAFACCFAVWYLRDRPGPAEGF